MTDAEIQACLKAFEDHLLEVERVFNAQSDRKVRRGAATPERQLTWVMR
jgi:hypothetical protein